MLASPLITAKKGEDNGRKNKEWICRGEMPKVRSNEIQQREYPQAQV